MNGCFTELEWKFEDTRSARAATGNAGSNFRFVTHATQAKTLVPRTFRSAGANCDSKVIILPWAGNNYFMTPFHFVPNEVGLDASGCMVHSPHMTNLSAFAYHSPADLAQEAADHEFGARYDDVRERYASELADIQRFEDGEADFYARLALEEEAERLGVTPEVLEARYVAARALEVADQAAKAPCAACRLRISNFFLPF